MKTITKKTQPARRMTKKERFTELRAFVGLCFGMMEHLTWDEVAELSGLSRSTIRRLDLYGPSSLATHFGTVQALGIAAGLKLEMNPYSSRVSLVK